jgi:methylmalonyl-CoA/ethylmalonyl-CoA epimerase
MLPNFKFHHIGIATFSIDKTVPYYINAKYSKSNTVIDIIQKVKICFLSKENMPTIELLEPISNETSPIYNTLIKMGVTPYHCCYTVPDIENAIKELKKMYFIPILKPVQAIAMNDRKICFLYNKDIGLIEIVE